MSVEQHFFDYDKLKALELEDKKHKSNIEVKERHEIIDEDAVVEFLKNELLKGLVNGAKLAQIEEINNLTTGQIADLYKNDFGDEFDMGILLSGQDYYKARLGLQKGTDLDLYQKKAWEKVVRSFAKKYKFDLVDIFSFPEPFN